MFIIVGLGNPGKEYQLSRHNTGFMVIDALLGKSNKIPKKKFKSEFFKDLIEGEDVLLTKPMTYMNLSGIAVKDLLDNHPVDMEHLIIIHDDVDLELGRIKIKSGGGNAGHRGVKSIIEEIGSRDFIRIRVGTGRPESHDISMADHVLSNFCEDEKELLQITISKAVESVKMIIRDGTVSAMNKFNKRSGGQRTNAA